MSIAALFVGDNSEGKKLAMWGHIEPIYDDASPTIDAQAVERLCRVWGEVGQAIFERRRAREDR